MKKLCLSVFALTLLMLPCGSFAQQSKTTITTTESAGTISEVNPDNLVIRSESSPNPVVYTYTKKTNYINERGEPVSMETVKSGLPVTVYYSMNGSQMVADKVLVHETKTITTKAPIVEQQQAKTTTTTTRTN